MGDLLGLSDWLSWAKMLVEVVVFWIAIYAVLRFLLETRGTSVVRGLILIIASLVLAFVVLIKAFRLERLELVFEMLANITVLGTIVVFHPEIRRAISRFGDLPLFGRLLQRESRTVQRLLRAVARLSKDHIGALIAIEREASLQTHAETGIALDAELTSSLIESIFYPGGALHDGAIVVRNDRIVAASCLLPLSQSRELDERLGTRHRAALGLAEETDALAIVISEETGKISVAQNGKLSHDLDLAQLEQVFDQAIGTPAGAA